MPVKQVRVELGWGPTMLSGRWEPDQVERDAAWELYVELVTRIAVAQLGPGGGVLREALTSLHQFFGVHAIHHRCVFPPRVAGAPTAAASYALP